MIKAKQVFFWTSDLKGHGFHGDKATIFYLTSEHYSLSVLSAKLYFLGISPVHQKLRPCMMLECVKFKFSWPRRYLNWPWCRKVHGFCKCKKKLYLRIYDSCAFAVVLILHFSWQRNIDFTVPSHRFCYNKQVKILERYYSMVILFT